MHTQDVTTIKIFDIQNNFTNNLLNFNPPCQRESGIWNNYKEYLLIDSIMRGYIIPPLYLLQKRQVGCSTSYDIIDGSQRLHTILKFYGSQPISKDNEESDQDTYSSSSNNIISAEKLDFTANGILGYDRFKGYTIRQLCEYHYKSSPILNLSFSAEERGYIRRLAEFKFSVTYITKATQEELEDVFMRLNNGESLTIGERLNGLLPRLPLWQITQKFAKEIENDADIYTKTNGDKFYDEFDTKRKNDVFFWANITLALYDSLNKDEVFYASGEKQSVFARYEELYNYYCGKHYSEKKKSITESEEKKIGDLCKTLTPNTKEYNDSVNEIKADSEYQRSLIEEKIRTNQKEEKDKAEQILDVLKKVLPTFKKLCCEIPADTKRGYVLYSLFLYAYYIVINRQQESRLNDSSSLYNKKIKAFFTCLSRQAATNHSSDKEIESLVQAQRDKALEFRKNKSNDDNSRKKRFELLKEAIAI